jgi:hypothetical protein
VPQLCLDISRPVQPGRRIISPACPQGVEDWKLPRRPATAQSRFPEVIRIREAPRVARGGRTIRAQANEADPGSLEDSLAGSAGRSREPSENKLARVRPGRCVADVRVLVLDVVGGKPGGEGPLIRRQASTGA